MKSSSSKGAAITASAPQAAGEPVQPKPQNCTIADDDSAGRSAAISLSSRFAPCFPPALPRWLIEYFTNWTVGLAEGKVGFPRWNGSSRVSRQQKWRD